jgi:REP element-mobilizing transposase RayT
MATPRSQLVDPEYPMHYHLVSRCVRRSWLCGVDRQSRKDFEHRKDWLEERIHHLAQYFAVAIDAYAIMSNHFHLVVYFDPQESNRWSDEEVADRWFAVFPPRMNIQSVVDQQATLNLHRDILLQIPEKLSHARQTLGSLSMFMKHLKQPVAYQANKEDHCSGHFFEGRFYSGALLDENAVIAAMAYVDLNPIRARIVQHIDGYKAASGYKRSQVAINTPKRLEAAIEPLVSGLIDPRPPLTTTLAQFMDILEKCELDYQAPESVDKTSRWFDRVASLRKRQRAFGSMVELSHWRTDRGWSVPGSPLPAT